MFNKIRKFINRVLDLDIVRYSCKPTLSNHLRKMLALYNVNTVLDVGANIGQFSLLLRELGFTGDIHSFEPVIEQYTILKELAERDSNWYVYNFALGDYVGEVPINISESSTLCSVLKASEYGKSLFSMLRVDDVQMVAMKTIDHCVEEGIFTLGERSLLKMDTQGFDLNVFKGAEASLDRIPVLLTELSFKPIYNDMPRYIESLSLYEKHGYFVSSDYPVNVDVDGSLIEADCFLVKPSMYLGNSR